MAVLVAACAAACGSSSTNSGPTATPLPTAELQRQYRLAADTYNSTETPITGAENTYCASTSRKADLNKCEAALSQDRLATIAYDNAVRSIAFPASLHTDVNKLLDDDAQLERLLEQASTAPSLSAIVALSAQIFALLKTTSQDADKVRADIGLPAASPLPATASPAA